MVPGRAGQCVWPASVEEPGVGVALLVVVAFAGGVVTAVVGCVDAPGAGGSTGTFRVRLPALANVNVTGIACPTSNSRFSPVSVGALPSAM